MQIIVTTFPGLTFDLLVEEVNHRDPAGRLLCYLASIYRQEKGTVARHLIRRSRLPGSADAMRHELQRDGIQAFRRLEPPNASKAKSDYNHKVNKDLSSG
ncbi:hypothetical protein N1937_02040 [Rhizobium sp. WSM4643]|uniref:hypothetical protein n=1 Tax=Rhizobium sp. WSM4643 TaxID=3138253 RepID=UPI0021A96F6E|nr:hypothetical protein [Rhizobium leguminosarum]UWM76053.1 hypothetical protein N1937_02040 [Rhizobium leguminosarum bv. viciae]